MPSENNAYRPILGNGQYYIGPAPRPAMSPSDVPYPTSFEEARTSFRSFIRQTRDELSKMPHALRLADAVLCLRMYPQFLAKTFYPIGLFNSKCLADVGSRRWHSTHVPPHLKAPDPGPRPAKLIFVRTNGNSLDSLDRTLDRPESEIPKALANGVRMVEGLTFLRPEERMLGFGGWSEGLVEMVLHPLDDLSSVARERLVELLSDNDKPQIAFREYDRGLTFALAHLDLRHITLLRRFNPLRTAHPVRSAHVQDLRGAPSRQAPALASPPGGRSSIVVGVFDGGLDRSNPLVGPYADLAPLSVRLPCSNDGVAHGTAVAGAVLYGQLNGVNEIKEPPVSVEVFRVLPVENDWELYESIDLVEAVVPQRPGIRVYNLSLGPIGPIVDDEICRFTYALDQLAERYRVLFVVAVGNDGARPGEEARIQAPADIVNGMGIGAFTYDGNGQIQRAPYSCTGFGREGCKIKPDVVAFGGCPDRPMHVVAPVHGTVALSYGTSFASPIVAGRAAELLGRCSELSPLAVRALLVHTANHPRGQPDADLGHGQIAPTVDAILRCSSDEALIIYQAGLSAGAYAKLAIPVPRSLGTFSGLVTIRWTIALLSSVDPANVDEYTRSCVEDTFYPHAEMFTMASPDRKRSTRVHRSGDSARIDALQKEGWRLPANPDSRSARRRLNEAQLRMEYKWDTVVSKEVRQRGSSLSDPFLRLHGIARAAANAARRLDYAVVVSIAAPSYTGVLYDDVLMEYSQLRPIQVRSVAEVRIASA